jgi:hypothetical protein
MGPDDPETSAPLTFFKNILDCFQRAEGQAGAETRYYRMGSAVVCFRFAGEALINSLTPAFEHLTVAPVPDAALTVCLWDTASTGVKPPSPPWQNGDFLARGEVRGYNTERFTTTYDLFARTVSVLDEEQRLAVHWMADAANVPDYEMGGPLRKLLYAWAQRRGQQVVHAGAVGRAEGGVLLAGKSGSGKSSTALACLDSDLRFVCDDACLLEIEPRPYVYSLYSTCKITNDNLWRFPNLVPYISNPQRLPDEKAIIFLNRCLPEKLIAGFPVGALLIPRITGQAETTFQPASAREGVQAVAPSSIFQSAADLGAAFSALAQLVRQIPCYYLNLGHGLKLIPPVIEQILDGLGV